MQRKIWAFLLYQNLYKLTKILTKLDWALLTCLRNTNDTKILSYLENECDDTVYTCRQGINKVQEQGSLLLGSDKENWGNQYIDVLKIWRGVSNFILKPCSWERNHFIHPCMLDWHNFPIQKTQVGCHKTMLSKCCVHIKTPIPSITYFY